MPLWSRPSGIGIRQQYLLENAPPADPELARLATANITCGGYHVESVIAGKSKPENFGIRQTFCTYKRCRQWKHYLSKPLDDKAQAVLRAGLKSLENTNKKSRQPSSSQTEPSSLQIALSRSERELGSSQTQSSSSQIAPSTSKPQRKRKAGTEKIARSRSEREFNSSQTQPSSSQILSSTSKKRKAAPEAANSVKRRKMTSGGNNVIDLTLDDD